jgi:uncharacterized protein YegL
MDNKEENMSVRDEMEIPKKTMVVFFIVDTSAQMDGAKSGCVNRTIQEMIPEIKERAEYEDDVQVKIAALAYSSKARWKNPDGPVDVLKFIWNGPTVGGESNLGAAFKALNEKLSSEAFLKDAGGYFVPCIFLFSGSKPADDWQKESAALKVNNWFKRAIKWAIAVGDDADKSVLKEFTGSMESLIEGVYVSQLLNPGMLRRFIKFVHWIPS